MNEQEAMDRMLAIIDREERDPRPGLYWLSFVDKSRAQGERFLGVTIVHAVGPMCAISRAHELGANPGGEAVIAFLPEGFNVAPRDRDRLLSRAEAALIERQETTKH
jgi:hypothetical protein